MFIDLGEVNDKMRLLSEGAFLTVGIGYFGIRHWL
jgi:hypothetical protein